MKKKLSIALTGALAVGLAVPAMAETTFSGTLTVMPMYTQDKDTVSKLFKDDNDPIKPIDQRLRFTMMNKTNDFVSVVWQAEIDTPWGSKSTADGKYTDKAGAGGALGTDGVNLETKHLYMDVKVPETAFQARLGLQSVKDTTLDGLYFWYDVAAGVVKYNKDALSVNVGIAKPADDDELWIAAVGYKMSDTLSLGLDVFQMDFEEGSDDDYTTIALGATTKVANFDIAAGLGFQSGDEASGMLLNLAGKTKINDIAAGARIVYVADDDEGEQWRFVSETPLAGEGLVFFGFSGNANYSLGRYAISDVAAKGYGLTGIILNASSPVATDYTVKGTLGYFQAIDDLDAAEGTSVGTEIDVSVSRKLAEKVDVSLIAGYAILGDFYEGTAEDGEDPVNPYLVGLRIVAPF